MVFFFLRPKKVSLSALQTTNRELTLIAAAAIMGLSVTPAHAKHPAASGMQMQL